MTTKRAMSKTKKLFVYGGTGLIAFLAFLATLTNYGITVELGEKIIKCAGNSEEPCIAYFNISLTDWNLCFGSTFQLYLNDTNGINLTVYKADMRYRADNPARWKIYNFKAGTCLKNETKYEFKVVVEKPIDKTVKWGLKTGLINDYDPVFEGYSTTDFVTLKESSAGLTESYAILEIRDSTTFKIPLTKVSTEKSGCYYQCDAINESSSEWGKGTTDYRHINGTSLGDCKVIEELSQKFPNGTYLLTGQAELWRTWPALKWTCKISYDYKNESLLKSFISNVVGTNIDSVEVKEIVQKTSVSNIAEWGDVCNPYTAPNGTTIANCSVQITGWHLVKNTEEVEQDISTAPFSKNQVRKFIIRVKYPPQLGTRRIYWKFGLNIADVDFILDPWWDATYSVRYPIIVNTTSEMVIAANDTYKIGGRDVYWTRQNNESYVYCSVSGCATGLIAIANTTNEKFWENETNRTGNSPTVVWGNDTRAVWHFGEGSGTNASDSSGNSNTGTLQAGASFNTSGRFGIALQKTATSAGVTVTNNAGLNPVITSVSAWIYRLSDTGGDENVISNWNAPCQAYYMSVSSTDSLRCLWGDGTNAYEFTTGTSIPINTWTLISCVRNATHVVGYINGIYSNSVAMAPAMAAQTSTIYIGSDGGSAGRINGLIDELRIYNRTLTSTEELNMWYEGINNMTRLGPGEQTDTTPPKWSLNQTNSTLGNSAINHSLNWTDATGLSVGIFSWNGSLSNVANNWTNITNNTISDYSVLAGKTVIFDSKRNVSWKFGGSIPDVGDVNSTYSFSTINNTWNLITVKCGATCPAPRHGHCLVYDSQYDILIMFGGYSAGNLADTWQYNITNNTWGVLTVTGAPAARYYHSCAFDSRNNVTILSGGFDGVSTRQITYAFNYSNMTWMNMNPALMPVSNDAPGLAFDSKNNMTILFGGVNTLSATPSTWYFYNETWAYNYSNNTWINLTSVVTGNPEWTQEPGMVFNPELGKTMMIYGQSCLTGSGSHSDCTSIDYNANSSNSWLFDYATMKWENVTNSSSVLPYRVGYGYSYVIDGMILVGGNIGGGVRYNDTWFWNYSGGGYQWVNDSAVAFGAGTWLNVTKTAPPPGQVVGWREYVNDTASPSNWNASSIFTYTTTNPPGCRLDMTTWNTTYGVISNVTCYSFLGTTCNLYKNDTSATAFNNSLIRYGAAGYNFTCNATGVINSSIVYISQNTTTSNFMNLTLNGTETNRSYTYPAAINATGNYTASVFAGQTITFTLYNNTTSIGTTNPVSLNIVFGNGTYNFTYYTAGNTNYSAATKNYWLFEKKADVLINMWLNGTLNANKATVYPAAENATCLINTTGLWLNITRNGTYVGTYSTTRGEYNTQLAAQDYNFTCNFTSTANYSATSRTEFFTVNRGDVSLHLALNATESNKSYTYPGAVNGTGWKNGTSFSDYNISLWRDGVIKASSLTALSVSENILLGNASYNYTLTFSSVNYSATNISIDRFALVNKGTTTIYLALNGTQGNKNYIINQTINATAWKTVNYGNLSLYRNGTIFNTSLTLNQIENMTNASILQAFNYTATLNHENYTASQVERTVLILNTSFLVKMPEWKGYPIENTTTDSNDSSTVWTNSSNLISGGYKIGAQTITETENNNSQSAWNETFTGSQNNTFYVEIPNTATIIDAKLNLSGFPAQNKVDFFDTFDTNTYLDGTNYCNITNGEIKINRVLFDRENQTHEECGAWVGYQNIEFQQSFKAQGKYLTNVTIYLGTNLQYTSKIIAIRSSLGGSNLAEADLPYCSNNCSMPWTWNLSSPLELTPGNTYYVALIFDYGEALNICGAGYREGYGDTTDYYTDGDCWVCWDQYANCAGYGWTKCWEQLATLPRDLYFLNTYYDYYSSAYINSQAIDTSTSSYYFTANITNVTSNVPTGTSISYYLSSNGGSTWEATTPGTLKVFSNVGQSLKWRAILSSDTTRTLTPTIYNITINVSQGNYSISPYLDVSSDGDIWEWNHTGEFNSTYSPNRTANFSSEIQTYLTTCSNPCQVPFILHSDTAGIIQLDAINITYILPSSIIYAPSRYSWYKFDISNLPYFDNATLNLYQQPIVSTSQGGENCNATKPCVTYLHYSTNQTWSGISWATQPSYDSYTIVKKNFTSSEGWGLWDITSHLYSVLKNATFLLRIPQLNIWPKAMNFTSSWNSTYKPYVLASVTKYLINESSCTPSNTSCYQNGTFTPKGQTSSQWIWNITNIGNSNINVSAYWNATLPACMSHFLSTNSTLETSVDFNVSNTTNIMVKQNLGINANQTFWGFFYLSNCTAGVTTNATLGFSSTVE